ncbi:TPA: hypothetical protein OB753_002499 [Escherichia coli]|uniref:hypothetical protein n=1 Tax=Escherichia coli TaxID=562 RepID=UPI000BB5E7A4|nr:hypothetical protein [Escherichia coli]EFE5032289.1 hypothetical protein [Escherichia coli]EHH7505755.1 hypothetical protein [Escherichia coli]EHH7534978.1 hypothetical protein [Escherichia coli]PBQ60442.1 hypothetical protein COD50_25745 [Escherichia coli]PBR49452.1 hypothetical protein COD46_26590 [Escherichia coli]
MKDFPRIYYTLPMVAKKLGCTVDDVLHLGATNRLEICAYIGENDLLFSENKCSARVIFEDDSESYYVEQIKKRNVIDTDMYNISYFHYNDDCVEDTDTGIFRLPGWYANYLKGFFAIPSRYLVDVELSGPCNAVDVKPQHLYTIKAHYKKLYLAEIFGLCIPEERLVVFENELSNFDYAAKPVYGGGDRESPKTAAKRNEVIYSLIKLIPEMDDVDLDTESLPKIADLIDSIAASRGIEFPKTHWQTWQKYLGRESQQKRKK